MNNTSTTSAGERVPVCKGHRHRWVRTAVWCVAGVVCLIVLALTSVTLYLTPQRLTELVNREASDYLRADVRTSNLRFTLWSTFPRFCLQADSIRITSRALDALPPSLRTQLPADADFLASVGAFKGGVNLLHLLRGRVRLHNVQIDRLRVNLVSVNDTVANYLILPPDTAHHTLIPEISANDILLRNPQKVTFSSLASGLVAELDLNEMRLHQLSDGYDLTASGHIYARAGALTLLSDFPFRLGGKVSVGFHPLAVSFHDYTIALGNVHSHMSMNLAMGDEVKVNDFSYRTDSFRLMRLLEYLPSRYIPRLKALHTDISVNASARLLTPFNLTNGTLPEVEVNFNIPDGNLIYTLENDGTTEPVTMRHIGMQARLFFDGRNPAASYVVIPHFSLKGSGVTLGVEGKITDLLAGTPHVTAKLDIASDMAECMRYFPTLAAWHPGGEVRVQAGVEFDMPSDSLKSADSPAVSNVALHCRGTLTHLRGSGKDLCGNVDHLDFSFKSSSPMASAAGVREGMSDVKVSARGVHIATSRMSLRLGNLETALAIAPRHKIKIPTTSDYQLTAQPDARWLRKWEHSPEAVTLTLDSVARSFLATHRVGVTLRSGGATMRVAGYEPLLQFGPLALSGCNDSVAIERFSFRSNGSALSLSGSVGNLEDCLLSPVPQTLTANLQVDIDTLNINMMARALRLAASPGTTGSAKVLASSSEHTARSESGSELKSGSEAGHDSRNVTWLVPRNVKGHILLTGDEVIYTNLELMNPRAEIAVADGVLSMPALDMSTSFGTMQLGVKYDSSDIENLVMHLAGSLSEVNLERFFDKFHSLTEMCPSLKNLSGEVSLGVDVGMGINPDMSFGMQTMDGVVNVSGADLKLKQNDFIHHVARMMLITNRRPIRIHDIAFRATIHDNLLEVYPFNLDFEQYRLNIEGVNNFAGDLDYHIGVDHSPIPIPFGINISGRYHHPRLGFGRARWDRRCAQKVTTDISPTFTLDLVKEFRHYGRKFIDKAAESPADSD